MKNQMASKVDIGKDELIQNPDEDPEDSPIKSAYQTELFQITEEPPYSSNSVVSNKPSNYRQNSNKSAYNSLLSYCNNVNETFLLCSLMTPRLVKVHTDNGMLLPYIFRVSPGPKLVRNLEENFVCEFLEPESLT